MLAYSVARLLRKNLGKFDHIWVVVQRLGKIDHVVSRVLLVARSCSGKKSREGLNRDWIAFLSSTCGRAGGYPLLGGISNGLSYSLGQRCSSNATSKGRDNEGGGDADHFAKCE